MDKTSRQTDTEIVASSTAPTAEAAENVATELILPRVRSPRPVWQEALLIVFTWGFYTSFWMVGRLRDVNNVSKQTFTPWLWFFVPNIVIAQPSAFNSLFKELTHLEGDNTNPKWAKFDNLWLLILMVATVLSYVADRLAYSEIYYALVYTSLATLFCLLHQRFNHWKSHLTDVKFHSKASGYSIVEWIALVLGIIFTALLMYIVFFQTAFNTIRSLQDQELIKMQDPDYSFTVQGDEWTEVSIGTRSNGEAEFEMDGPLVDSWFVVFDHGKSSSIDEIARGRATLRDSFSGTPSCAEDRRLSKNEKSVISYTECKGRVLGDPISSFSTVIEADKQIVELYGEVSSAGPKYKTIREQMQKMARGFSPQ